MKKLYILFPIFLFLAGCWNYKELNTYSIVTGISIDKIDDQFLVSILISNSSNLNNDSEKSQTVVYSGKGDSIYLAIKDIGLISPKQIYLGHISVLILSEDIAKDGVLNITDFFIREATAKKNFFVVIAKGGLAKDTLKIISPLTNFPSQNIADNLHSTTQLQGVIASINFNEFLSSILRPGIDPVVNSIYVVGDEKKGSTEENIKSSEPNAYLKLGNLGIFKDNKLVDWANTNESIGINIINNKIKELYIKIKYNNNTIIISTANFKTNVDINFKNSKPYVSINSTGESKIVEINDDIDLNDTNVLNEITKLTNEQIEKYCNEAIDLAIKNKTDIFGFGLKFYQKYPKYYKKNSENWNDNLHTINYKINSNIILKNRGSAQNSLGEIHDK